jgi:hypothetical protein
MLDRYIRFDYFIASFAIGMFFTYIYQPPLKVVMRFPNPNNVNELTYTDSSENCYKYKAEEMSCSDVPNKDDIAPQPILEDFKGRNKNHVKTI